MKVHNLVWLVVWTHMWTAIRFYTSYANSQGTDGTTQVRSRIRVIATCIPNKYHFHMYQLKLLMNNYELMR